MALLAANRGLVESMLENNSFSELDFKLEDCSSFLCFDESKTGKPKDAQLNRPQGMHRKQAQMQKAYHAMEVSRLCAELHAAMAREAEHKMQIVCLMDEMLRLHEKIDARDEQLVRLR
eukprot:TRINITY_DN1570_c0_g1_i3.p1 TRINITY_DN1570_c0_g1~~TRINITY_DN1570_c0_g1_i3.p1  ORF type:complete len:118 (-),score=18.84 TRINITY_DN1570_c0_g1_i3:55-408(-)